jgi:rapamycin-insensitive companion of mTOR
MTPATRPSAPNTGPSANAATQRNDGLLQPNNTAKDGRSLSSAASSFSTIKPAQSYGRSAAGPQGSFASNVTTLPYSRTADISRVDYGTSYATFDGGNDTMTTSEQRQADYRTRIEKETKIKLGTENLLEALNSKKEKQARDQRKIVETELNTSTRKIAQLKLDLEAEIQRGKEQQQPLSPKGRLSQLFRSAPLRTPEGPGKQLGYDGDDEVDQAQDPELESPTYILAEILQALEVEDLRPDYYVGQANDLVELFRRHPTLKYDLAWSIFGLRMQMLLLSDSREVVAAGYRVMRYAITDRKSLQTIRALQTDFLVILSLVKESKARVEREQALKFVRAFLDVKDGCSEIHPAVARVLVAVADHSDDTLRSIAILTLAEMLLKGPQLVIDAGGVNVLADAMGSGSYHAPEALIVPLLHLMDLPARRSMLKSGFEFSSAFATFTEPHVNHFEDRLRSSSRVISAMFKSWPGLMTLSLHDFLPVRSVVSSLYIPSIPVRTATLDLLFDILRIRSPSWTKPFLGGRRLTTYNRVANLRVEKQEPEKGKPENETEEKKRNLVEHFTAVALAVLLRHGLLKALIQAESDSPTVELRRQTSLLIAEVLRMASDLLPPSWSQSLQAMPDLLSAATAFSHDERFHALATVYQVDSLNRTLYRSFSTQPSTTSQTTPIAGEDSAAARARATSKTQVNATMDQAQFKLKMTDTGVLSSVNWYKWDWVLIQELIEGPMVHPLRYIEAQEGAKFIHRLLGFLRPFKNRFSDEANTKSNQRYVRTACSLIKCMLQHPEGFKELANSKMVAQLAECLAQLDPMSGITSQTNIFSPQKLSEKLVGGYFTMLGVMCKDQRGIHILIRWKIINMFYHIVELKNRDDLIKVLLTNLDYTLDSHPRIILSKAMIAGSKGMRITATRMLRKYALMPIQTQTVVGGGAAEWAIRLLVGQLYDPEVEVCEVAIKILEEACNNLTSLEYVVKCRPALDHLGEIGAPLLLRFLSTSVGYHYLDGLDYITKEMDDWFLGRNDTYVALVETSLARALAGDPEKPSTAGMNDEQLDGPSIGTYTGTVPPHFYRELTRTAEGCELLKAKGHFEEFAATIQDFAMEDEDPETILKVKGCLWAVGNVGSMELGAPFLERTDVVKDIVQIAEESQVMTLRGTAFFVLGLVSRSLHGQEILAELGWDGVVGARGEGLGYVLPGDFDRFFSLKLFDNARRPSVIHNRPAGANAVTDDDPTNAGILASITKLGNTVLTNKALAELNAFKHKKSQSFRSVRLFRKALTVLAGHGYGIMQWRFVCDLFEKEVLRKVVLEEDDEDEEGGSADGEAEESAEEEMKPLPGVRSRSGT